MKKKVQTETNTQTGWNHRGRKKKRNVGNDRWGIKETRKLVISKIGINDWLKGGRKMADEKQSSRRHEKAGKFFKERKNSWIKKERKYKTFLI